MGSYILTFGSTIINFNTNSFLRTSKKEFNMQLDSG